MSRRNAEIDKIALFIETGGQAYAVTLPHERLMILVQMASSLSDTGALPVQKLPDGFEFTTIGEVQSEQPTESTARRPAKLLGRTNIQLRAW